MCQMFRILSFWGSQPLQDYVYMVVFVLEKVPSVWVGTNVNSPVPSRINTRFSLYIPPLFSIIRLDKLIKLWHYDIKQNQSVIFSEVDIVAIGPSSVYIRSNFGKNWSLALIHDRCGSCFYVQNVHQLESICHIFFCLSLTVIVSKIVHVEPCISNQFKIYWYVLGEKKIS